MPDGPASYAEISQMPRYWVLQESARQHPGLFKLFENKMEAGVVGTSCYSGMGCVDVCYPMLGDAANDIAGRLLPGFLNYSCADIDDVARYVLASHHARSRPQHLFGDLLDPIT